MYVYASSGVCDTGGQKTALSVHKCFLFIPVQYSIKSPFILYMCVCASR